MVKMKKKAQNLSEYAIMLGVIIGAVLVSQDMVKKALIGKIRDGAETLKGVGKGVKIGDELTGATFGITESTDPVRQLTNTSGKSSEEKKVNKGMDVQTNATSTTNQIIELEKLY